MIAISIAHILGKARSILLCMLGGIFNYYCLLTNTEPCLSYILEIENITCLHCELQVLHVHSRFSIMIRNGKYYYAIEYKLELVQ